MEERAAAEQVFATNDPAEARSLLTSIYVPHELRSRDGLPLNFKIRYLQSTRLTLGHVRYGADSEVLVPPMEHCYHLNITLAGRTLASQGGSAVSTAPGATAVMFGPEHARAVRWSPDAVQYAVKIPRASMEGQLAALIGRPVERPLRFSLDVDLAGPQGQSLLAAIGHLRTELSRSGGLTESPLVRAQLESYVLSQLLFVVPSDHHDLLRDVGQRVGRRHIRVALDYIDEHLAEPLAGPDIARAASVSVRALQAGFQDDIGMSPMAYVRSRRLDRVHEELLTDADGALINEVAARWGFFHFGRFAEQYRMRFGVLPSMTAREGRTRRSR